jgi:hypothetical protein
MPDTTTSVPAQGLESLTFGMMKDHAFVGFANVGSSPTPGLRFTLTGLNLNTPTPTLVAFHPRQSDNNEHNFADEFAVQVITTAKDHILGRVLRLDTNSRWGQQLRLDFLIITPTLP